MADVEKINVLAGRTLWVPRMSYSAARLFSAVFRSIGIDARECEDSDERTLSLGGLHTSGEECYPAKITLGDFLRIIDSPDFDPSKHAFFMPTANGPCRFGQYSPYLQKLLRDMGHGDVPVISPTSENGYGGMTDGTMSRIEMTRSLWRGIVCGDLLLKMLLKTRPYERTAGDADMAFESALARVEKVLETPGLSAGKRLDKLVSAMTHSREDFRRVPAKYTKDRPLIGVVGEIFCRMNTFSNYDACRQIEAHGGECWLSDICEWVWYTNWSEREKFKRDRKLFTLKAIGALVRNKLQRSDEDALNSPFAEDFVGYEEPHDIYEGVLKKSWPYLPADRALGEMTLSAGKSVYLYEKGADGIIDISPFGCMNGIVTEAVYHDISADCDEIPIRNFYFDSTTSNLQRDLDIFMALARSYRMRKTRQRVYPKFFE